MEPITFLSGKLVPAAQAGVSLFDAGLFGIAVSETIRTFHQRPYRLADHLDRLFRSAELAEIPVSLGSQELHKITDEMVEHNRRLLDRQQELGIVQLVTAGPLARFGSMPDVPGKPAATVAAFTYPLKLAQWSGAMRSGVHVVTPSIRQGPPRCVDPHIKSRSRLHFYLADRHARSVDPEAIALLLDLDGHITEAAAANFLVVEKETLISPLESKILPGVSRAQVMQLASVLGMAFVEEDVKLARAQAASEAFLTSTPYCMLPVVRLNGQPIGTGRPGPIFQRLLAAWSGDVGLDIAGQIINSPRSA
jgi:branched-chain amino acid aminotransferase